MLMLMAKKSFHAFLPYWIIGFYLWTSIPSRLFSIVWLATLYLLVFLFICTKGKSILISLFKDPSIIGLIALSGFSYFWSVEPSSTFASFRSLIVQYVLVGYLVTNYELYMIINIVGKALRFTGILSLFYIVFLPNLAFSERGAWWGIFLHQSSLAATMALAIITSFYIFLTRQNKRSRTFEFLIIVQVYICAHLLIFGAAKTAIVGCLLSFSLLPFFFLKHIKGMKIRNLVFIGLVYILLIVFSIASFLKEYIIVDILGKNMSLSGRSYLWEYLFSQIADRPFGHGLDAFWHNEESLQGIVEGTGRLTTNAHSNYIDVLLGLGYPGLILLSICLVLTLKRVLTLVFVHRQPEFFWGLQVIILLLVASYSDNFIGFIRPRAIGWFLFCIISLLSAIEIDSLKRGDRSVSDNPYLVRKSRIGLI